MPYTEVNIADYNATPPTDDGSTAAINLITWAKIKTKLGDPLNAAFSSLNSNIGSASDGVDADIAAAEVSITAMSGDISGEEDTLTAPDGTELFFVQTAAPTGWTKNTTHNDKAIRLVSGTVSTGGSTAFTSVFASRTIAAANIPSHTHNFSQSSTSLSFSRTSWTTSLSENSQGGRDSGGTNCVTDASLSTSTISATISFSGTSGSAGDGSAMDFAVEYVDIILAVK